MFTFVCPQRTFISQMLIKIFLFHLLPTPISAVHCFFHDGSNSAFTSRYMVLHVLPLYCFPTFERTFYWIVGTGFIMTSWFCNGMIGILVLLAVFTHIRPRRTFILQVTVYFTLPHLLSTSCTLHFIMEAARLVGAKIFQFSFPLTPTLMVFTVDFQLLYFPYTIFVENMLGVQRSAVWASWASSVSEEPIVQT